MDKKALENSNKKKVGASVEAKCAYKSGSKSTYVGFGEPQTCHNTLPYEEKYSIGCTGIRGITGMPGCAGIRVPGYLRDVTTPLKENNNNAIPTLPPFSYTSPSRNSDGLKFTGGMNSSGGTSDGVASSCVIQ